MTAAATTATAAEIDVASTSSLQQPMIDVPVSALMRSLQRRTQVGPSRPPKYAHLSKSVPPSASTASLKMLKERVKKEVESYFGTCGAGAGEQTDIVRFWIETPPYSRLYPSLCGRIHSHIYLFAVFTDISISLRPLSRPYPSRCGRIHDYIHLVAAVFTAISTSLRPCSRLYPSRCCRIYGYIHLVAAVFTAISISLRPHSRPYPSRCNRIHGNIHLFASVFTAMSFSLRPYSRPYSSCCGRIHK
ncbi:unnamed protein product [Sphagnum balticum]